MWVRYAGFRGFGNRSSKRRSCRNSCPMKGDGISGSKGDLKAPAGPTLFVWLHYISMYRNEGETQRVRTGRRANDERLALGILFAFCFFFSQ